MQLSSRRRMDKRVEGLGDVSPSRRHIGKRVTLRRLVKLSGIRSSNSQVRRGS